VTFELRLEWEDAPKVRSPVLAVTWARFEIRVEGKPLTQFWSESANAIRTGVYGSVFPLARWVVRHWWHLLDETLCNPAVLSGARGARDHERRWLERHNLVYAREGMAYPDLSIYREDDLVGLRWVRDAESVTTPGRFLGDGAAHLARSAVEAGLARLVESVVERTADLGGDEEVAQLRADWAAIVSSTREEQVLCARLAGLGLDPYGSQPDEAVEDLLAGDLGLSEPVIQDLLAATDAGRLGVNLQAVRTLVACLPSIDDVAHRIATEIPYDARPYRAGYQRADAVRRRFGLDPSRPLDDLAGLVDAQLGAVSQTWITVGDPRDIEAAVERNGTYALAGTARSPRAQRFLLARALHHWQFVNEGRSAVRLLTRANDWQQSASRAFAAELLAPAAALATRLAGESGWERQQELADDFQVSPMVIAHQIENHGLG